MTAIVAFQIHCLTQLNGIKLQSVIESFCTCVCVSERGRVQWMQGWASVPVETIRWSWCLTKEGRKRERERGREKKREIKGRDDPFLRFIPIFPSQYNNQYIN